MRAFAMAACALLGCGRLGFDSRATDAPGTTAPRVCPAHQVFDLGTSGIIDMAAAPVPGGIALGFVQGPTSSLYGVVLDTNLVAQTTLQTTSPLQYDAVAMRWDGTHLFAALQTQAGTVWLKTLALDMSNYLTAIEEPGAQTEGVFAAAGGTSFAVLHTDTSVTAWPLAGDGTPTGSTLALASSTSPMTTTSAAPVGDFTAVAWAAADGTCHLAALAGDQTSLDRELAPTCSAPFAIGGVNPAVAYSTGTAIELRTIDIQGPPLAATIGAPRVLATGTHPHLTGTPTGNSWLARLDGSLRASAYSATSVTELELIGLPAGIPDAWDVTASDTTGYGFAVYGSAVWGFELCAP